MDIPLARLQLHFTQLGIKMVMPLMMPFVFLKGFQFSPGPRSKVWGATQLVLHNSAHFHQVVVANLAMYALLNFRSLKLKTCSIFQNGHHPNESSHSYPSVLLWAKVCFLRTYLTKSSHPKIWKNGPISSQLYEGPFLQILGWLDFI